MRQVPKSSVNSPTNQDYEIRSSFKPKHATPTITIEMVKDLDKSPNSKDSNDTYEDESFQTFFKYKDTLQSRYGSRAINR
jgi:hypothetical protein